MSKVLVLAVVVAGLAAAVAAAAVGPAPGVYVTKETGATPSVLNGTWRLTLSRKRFTLTKNRSPAVAGSVAVSSKRITFHDLSGRYRCRGSQAVGTYGWYLRGRSLTLTVVKDPCSPRQAILTNGFTKSP
jgi:hypothetical protein